MKKKIIILVIIGLILIIGLSIFIDSKCKRYDTGWSCSYKVGFSGGIYKKICELQGGKWKCYGFCVPNYAHYCDFPYDDAGKECVNSNQCNGKCIVEEEEIKRYCPDEQIKGSFKCEGAMGKCAQYPLRMCDYGWVELNDNTVTVNMVLCD